MSIKKSLFWVLFWMIAAAVFNLLIYQFIGEKSGIQFLGGYIIELTLSMDNLFVFLLIFENFRIPPLYQRRVLNYGIFGAIILRLVFTVLGVSIVNRFHWVLYVFGAVLFFSAFKMAAGDEKDKNYKDSKMLAVLNKIIPVSNSLEEERFFIWKNKKLYATPLFAIIFLIEGSDIIFAIDSIPAIFSITTNPFIVYSSNIFAILGLRSLYFILQRMHNSFFLVRYGVALILAFTGAKLLLLMFSIEISLIVSISIIIIIMTSSILLSILIGKNRLT